MGLSAAAKKGARWSLSLGRTGRKRWALTFTAVWFCCLLLAYGVGYIPHISTQTLTPGESQCYTALTFFFFFLQLWSLYCISSAPKRNLVHLIMEGLTAINLPLTFCLQNNYLHAIRLSFAFFTVFLSIHNSNKSHKNFLRCYAI